MIKFSLNTNCLRKKFSRTEIVRLAHDAGVAGIEWGLDGLETAVADIREMRALTAAAGLEVVGFINAGPLWKTDLIRCWSEAAAGDAGTTLRVEPPWYAWDYREAEHQRESFLAQLQLARNGLEKLQETGREFRQIGRAHV